ncbi:tetratricopeptide repeat protein [Wenyingzhuangia heitensis]|uniref:tetratricopeptide repeat protein n=1 Tax=Wenyingzhuangia heitensis TaxID=1487859 RepID=UPI001ABB31D5|nr:tetratricopeptide repeat protein [Wenyingzhuangia heitensis]
MSLNTSTTQNLENQEIKKTNALESDHSNSKNTTNTLEYEQKTEQILWKAKKAKDTLLIIDSLLKLSNRHRYRGDYDLSFDNLWDALLLTKQKKHDVELQEIHRGLGILYNIYHKDSLSLHHLNKALTISKNLLKEKKIKKSILISSYFTISMFWRDKKNYSKALIYLDSCASINNHQKELPYVITDVGYCNLKLGNLPKADSLLHKGKKLLEEIKSPYLVANLSFLGDLKKEQSNYKEALNFYKQANIIQQNQKVHLELKPELLKKIADIYIIQKKYVDAISYLKESQKSFENLFSTTNKNNHRLFEIKNKYLAELTENKKIIDTQYSIIEKKNKKLLLIFILLGGLFLSSVVVYIIIYQRNKIKKISLINSLDKEKNKAVLKVKSKELTTHALKMIEKEETIQSLLNTIKKTNLSEYNKLQNKHAKGSDRYWEEFNKRFTEVNIHFHETLCKKHPDLSPTELKHCALIKLNFNSHEMAKILNISLQSVHTSRYRIRKKMGLDSNNGLQTYIGSI